jgi:hypothetical protein
MGGAGDHPNRPTTTAVSDGSNVGTFVEDNGDASASLDRGNGGTGGGCKEIDCKIARTVTICEDV